MFEKTLTEDFIELNTSSPLDNCEQVEDKNRDSVDPEALTKTDNIHVPFKTRPGKADPGSNSKRIIFL